MTMELGAQLDSFATAARAAAFWIVARPFWLLVALQVLDIVSGVLVAYRDGRVSSQISRDGMTRKVAFILAAAFGTLLEPFIKFESGPAVGQGIAWMLCAPEAISVYENLVKLGVPLPKRDRLEITGKGER